MRRFSWAALPVALALSAYQAQPGSGGISPWFWIVLLVVLLLLIIWLARLPSRDPRETPAASPEPDILLADTRDTAPDDLEIIEGIGPKIAAVLQAAGITTFSQLAAADPARLRAILDEGGVRLADPRSWPEQALLAAAGDMDGLNALQSRLTAGRQAEA
jgi:hypothetical protein